MSHLPPGWTEVALGDVCEIVSGATPKTSVRAFWGGPVRWVTPKDLSDLGGQRYLRDTPRTLTEDGLRSCGAKVLPAGSVLFSSRAPVGLTAINTVPVATNQGFKSLVPSSRIHAEYLYWWLTANRSRMEQLGRGATFKEVSKRIVAEVRIPLPPLEEQRRIAAILDKADELRAKRRRARSHLADLQGSLFKAMFGRAVDNGSGRVLGDLIEIQIGPFGSLLHQSDYVVGGVPLVNPMHLVDGRIVPRSRETVAPEAVERLGRYVLREGDVVLGRRGDMGRCAVVGPAEAGFICGSGSMILRPHSDNVRPRFLAAALSSLEARDELARRAKGVTMLNLNSDAVASVRLVCPPLDEQIRFERAIHEVDLRAKAQVRSEEDLDSLFASLQSRAFRGEL